MKDSTTLATAKVPSTKKGKSKPSEKGKKKKKRIEMSFSPTPKESVREV